MWSFAVLLKNPKDLEELDIISERFGKAFSHITYQVKFDLEKTTFLKKKKNNCRESYKGYQTA